MREIETGERADLGPCLLCWRIGRWPGFYCCDEHEARAKMPAGLGLFDKAHPNHRRAGRHQVGGKRTGRR